MPTLIGGMMYVEGGAVNTIVNNVIPENITPIFAMQWLKLKNASWRVALEEQADEYERLPEGTVEAHFRPMSTDRNYAEQQLLSDYLDRGQVIGTIRADTWLKPDFTGDEDIDELDIIAAVRMQTFGPDYEYAFIRELMVHPDVQNQGLGSAVVHAALHFGYFDARGRVAAHALATAKNLDYFYAATLGLERRDEITPPPFVFSRGDLPVGPRLRQVHFETPPFVGVQGVIDRLEERRTWLQRSFRLPGTIDEP